MTATAIAATKRLSLTDFIAYAMQYVRQNEVTVPAAVAATWTRYSAQLDPATISDLARSGAEARLHRVLSEERFIAPRSPKPSHTQIPSLRVVSTGSPASLQSRVVQFHRILDVRYVGRDGGLHPLRKFILTDVEAVIERHTSVIEGTTRIRDWFYRLRDEMKSCNTDRVAELPTEALERLSEQSPFAND